jgi:hypothetical protein
MKFKDSFMDGKILVSVAVDGFAMAAIALLFFVMTQILNSLSGSLQNVATPEQFQQLLVSASAEEAQALLGSLQSFLLSFLVGTVILIAGTFLIYSYSRHYLWTRLVKKSTKRYWKWNGLVIGLLIAAVLYFLVTLVIRIPLTSLLVSIQSDTLFNSIQIGLSSLFVLIFIMYMFFVYNSFAHTYRIWDSLGAGFHTIKHQWSKVWRVFLAGFGILLVLSIFLGYLQGALFAYSDMIFTVVNLILLLLYMGWFRSYVLRVVRH